MKAGDHVMLVDGQHAVVMSSPDWRGCVTICDDAGQTYDIGVSALVAHEVRPDLLTEHDETVVIDPEDRHV